MKERHPRHRHPRRTPVHHDNHHQHSDDNAPSSSPSSDDDDLATPRTSSTAAAADTGQAINLPAHMTKHLSTLHYHFPSLQTTFTLHQTNTSHSTGSSLWLSAQVLASYLLSLYPPCPPPSFPLRNKTTAAAATPPTSSAPRQQKRALELGAGTGLLSLLLARLGWHVTSTDIEPVLSTVLRPNASSAEALLQSQAGPGGTISVRELDWCWPPDRCLLSASDQPESEPHQTDNHHGPPDPRAVEGQRDADFDLILTADTIYMPHLNRPLFRTLAAFYHSYRSFSPPALGDRLDSAARTGTKPRILLALERRDTCAVDAALRLARDEFGLAFQRVPQRKVRKVFGRFGEGRAWSGEEWEGVEIWSL